MMRRYFPLEAGGRLLATVEEDDVANAQVSPPPTIAPSCTTKIIHDNYVLCLKSWLGGVNYQELLRLIRRQAKGDELTTDERKQSKYIRVCCKHLRFAQRLHLKKYQAGFLLGETTILLGHFQDGSHNGRENVVSFYGNLLRVYLSFPVWWLMNYSLRHNRLETVSGFIAYRQRRMCILKKAITKPQLAGREFHDMRKIISQQVPYCGTLGLLDSEDEEVLLTPRSLTAINGLTGDKHDDIVADDIDNRRSHGAPVVLDSDVHRRLGLLISCFPLYPEQ